MAADGCVDGVVSEENESTMKMKTHAARRVEFGYIYPVVTSEPGARGTGVCLMPSSVWRCSCSA